MKLLSLLLLGGLAVAEDVPQWLRQSAARAVLKYPPKVSSVVLLHEEHLTISPDGRHTMVERGAIRILQRSRDRVAAWRAYNLKTGRIREFRAWLLQPDGREQQFKPDQIVDIALSQNYTYDEARAKALDCPATAPPGSVFAYEIVEEERSIFTQAHYSFQERDPVLTSRFLLSLPPGWEQREMVFNHASIQPAVANGAYTWELTDLPFIDDEEYAPGFHTVAPRLAVTVYPPAENSAGLRPLKDWAAVSGWLSEFVEPSAAVSAAIRAKASELAADAGSELEKIRAIATYAQKVNYVEVAMNLTHGGGYTPHLADQVLAVNYGDCKDKATLMKALFAAAGIESFVTVAYSGDPQYVRPEWPSSLQFNHAITAVRVGPGVDLPAVAAYPNLGKFLFFDPTDPYTPLGDVPEQEQGSHMLVLAGLKGELVTVPRAPLDASRVESNAEARLDANGLLAVRLRRQQYGERASALRAALALSGKDEVRRIFERAYTQRLGGLKIGSLETADRAPDRRFDVALSFDVNQFGQLQSRLLLIKPGTIVPGTRYAFPARERKLPVKLDRSLNQDRIAIQLPMGFKVDEMPDPVAFETPYGAYRARYSEAAGALHFEQTLEVRDIVAPAEEYSQIRDFFEKVAGYQQAAVVLVKQ